MRGGRGGRVTQGGKQLDVRNRIVMMMMVMKISKRRRKRIARREERESRTNDEDMKTRRGNKEKAKRGRE